MHQGFAPHVRRDQGLRALLLVLLTGLIYASDWRAPFFFDDLTYLVNNPVVRAPGGLAAIWRGENVDYWPISYSFFWLGWRLWGDWVPAWHLVNCALHLGNALLLVPLLSRLRVRGAWLIAALFLCHPVCVESVAWIFQIKTTLATMLGLLATLALLKFLETDKWVSYALSCILLALSLLAKTSTLMLPVLFLGLIWHGRKDIGFKRLALLCVPYMGIAFVLGLIGLHFQQIPLDQRLTLQLLQPVTAFWFYLGKVLWPFGLSLFYGTWSLATFMPWLALAALLGVGFTLFGWRHTPPAKRALVALSVYALLLLPVLGVVPLAFMKSVWVADHWQYAALPVALAYVVDAAARVIPRGLYRGVAVVALGVLVVSAWQRAKVFAGPMLLWQESVAAAPNVALAHYNLANLYQAQGNLDATEREYAAAAQADPTYALAAFGLGSVRYQRGDWVGAEANLRRALLLNPNLAEVHANLAQILDHNGRQAEALEEMRKAVAIAPGWRTGRFSLGLLLFGTGKLEEAREEFAWSLRPAAGLNLGRIGLNNDFPQTKQAQDYLDEIARRLAAPQPK